MKQSPHQACHWLHGGPSLLAVQVLHNEHQVTTCHTPQAGCPSHYAEMLLQGGIRLLIAYLRQDGCHAESAALTLHNAVALHAANQAAACQAGAFPALLELLGTGPDSLTTESAARCIHALAQVSLCLKHTRNMRFTLWQSAGDNCKQFAGLLHRSCIDSACLSISACLL